MTRFSHFGALVIVVLAAAACGAPPPPAPAAAHSAAPQDQLSHVFDRYWDEHIAFEDEISPQSLADSLDAEKRFLAELLAIPRDALGADDRISYDIFKRQRETAIEGFTYPGELTPINPFAGVLWAFPAAVAQSAAAPMSVAQYDRWLKDADVYVSWTRQAIINMQQGVLRGYVAPRALIERALPMLERLAMDSPSNAPQNGSLRDAVAQKIRPATRALHDYLLHSYLPKTRAGLGLADLPLGASWYAYRLRRAVGSAAMPADIHRIGLTEVERLRPRLQALRDSIGSPPGGTALPAALPPLNEVLLAYESLGAQVAASLPNLFAASVPTPFEIHASDFILAPAMPLYYRAASPGENSGAILYVNSREISAKPVVASYLQQAVPGRHYQSAIQQQRLDLPRFRRFGDDPAFVAGWELYAVLLGEELGAYSNEADRYQALNLQMRCAAALVIDTGLHSQGWSRAQSLEYLHAQMSIDDNEAEGLVDAYAAMPGDALSCAMGALKLQALRSRMQQSLGARFDIHEFHDQILKDGAMPLDILDTKMTAWMQVSR